MNDIREVLNERGVNYGSFAGQSELSQLLKKTIDIEIAKRGKSLNSYQKEALEMILHKIARIINGNPDYADSWLDISGYASLVVAQLNRKSTICHKHV